jgi:Mrp family chromosome partitioning ATPase
MRSLRDLYDIVIVDSPPCAGLSDMQVISTFSDGVLLVVSLDTTRIDTLDNTIQTLALVEAPFLGFVTNKVSVKKLGYDYYGYPRQESASA